VWKTTLDRKGRNVVGHRVENHTEIMKISHGIVFARFDGARGRIADPKEGNAGTSTSYRCFNADTTSATAPDYCHAKAPSNRSNYGQSRTD